MCGSSVGGVIVACWVATRLRAGYVVIMPKNVPRGGSVRVVLPPEIVPVLEQLRGRMGLSMSALCRVLIIEQLRQWGELGGRGSDGR